MNNAIVAGEMCEIAEGVRRLTAPNPGMMTGPGTNSYLIGSSEIAVIDPGPVIEGHLKQLAQAGDIRWILATHTHPDHSPGAASLAEMTGAQLVGIAAPEGRHQDQTFAPGTIATDGAVLDGPDFRIEMLHTPGHASNHVCYLLERHQMLFTGDHIMNGSTVVIDPPDGDMWAYLESLARLMECEIDTIAPGHGAVFDNPYEVIAWITEHRLERERKVLEAVIAHPGHDARGLLPHVYDDVDKRLYDWAERSLLAHLIKLEKDLKISGKDSYWTVIEA